MKRESQEARKRRKEERGWVVDGEEGEGVKEKKTAEEKIRNLKEGGEPEEKVEGEEGKIREEEWRAWIGGCGRRKERE